MSNLSLNFYARSIHTDNITAGWWSNLETGVLITPLLQIDNGTGEKKIIKSNRNAGELLALVHSELSEAWEAEFFQTYDSHLPKYKGEGVEIGDGLIRLFDVAGAYGFNLQEDVTLLHLTTEEHAIFDTTTGQLDEGYCGCNAFVSRALEGFRKLNYRVAERNINLAILALISLANNTHRQVEDKIDIWHMISEKRAYNKSRADHKIENRLKDDGKKI